MRNSTYRLLMTIIVGTVMLMAVSCSKKDNGDVNKNDTDNSDKKVASESVAPVTTAPAKTVAPAKATAPVQTSAPAKTIAPAQTKAPETIKVATDQQIVWSYQTKGAVSSTPVVHGKVVIFGSNDGNLYAVDKESGKKVWEYTLGKPIVCTPVVKDNTVFFCGGEIYAAVDAKTGKEVWRNEQKVEEKALSRIDQWDLHDSSPAIDKNIVYFGSVTGNVFGFDVKTGKEVWKFAASESNPIRCTPLINKGVLYYGDWKGYYRAVDIKSKKVVWENDYKYVFQNGAVIKDGTLFVGGRDTCIHAIDCKTGKSKWEYKEPTGSWITGDPVVNDNIVYFSASDAKKVFALNVKDGAVAAEYPIYINSFTKVVIEKDKLYVTSGDAYVSPGTGKLQVYNLKDKEKAVGEVNLNTGGVFSSPVVSKDMIYFGSVDNNLYAVKLK